MTSEEKFLREVNKAKKNDIIIWNEATGEVIRGQSDSTKIREGITKMMLYKFHRKPGMIANFKTTRQKGEVNVE